ncbi:putative mitochondrial hypothetical protein [Leptomonas pyrrhocoris]|uniref:ADP-ribosylglycohydrolase n=1 Tax=Leptomonas pyrrhocoris TaxID=157538 RepID=A0A0M9G960_LEPPY|nr:putative mitochondrial hypothetical protein [Leptomonas pyrrhocoris]KPA85136.1 putative mitochondrial hypothetical protein [Leptomonas pyrrhocoris]|eukprot:XP_015663575.1 putative mitochondrial hypothetical protein [Leptomonas pyrrhocoris]
MAPMLSHTPRRVVDNFYQNSFKQLSMVQQKQVGLLVGAAVADAAARPLNAYTPEEVEAYLQRVQEERRTSALSSADAGTTAPSDTADESLAFARVPPRGTEMAPVTGSDALSSSLVASHSLQHHSFSYLLFFELLRAMSSARGDFPVTYVQEQLVRVAGAVHPTLVFEQEHASLLHTLCCLLPAPAIYPYASDATLRAYLDPFVEFLTESSVKAADTATRPVAPEDATPEDPEGKEGSPWEAASAERAAVRDYALSALGVVMRNLQSNPNSTRNAAFMAERGATAIFPPDVQPFVPAFSSDVTADVLRMQRQHMWDVQRQLASRQAASAAQRWLPVRRTVKDAAVVCESLAIARAPVSFAKGVVQAIRLGGPTCQRAMLVGALLGAKLGVRHVPLDWLSATPDHKPVATMALEVAQWSWNPPHH